MNLPSRTPNMGVQTSAHLRIIDVRFWRNDRFTREAVGKRPQGFCRTNQNRVCILEIRFFAFGGKICPNIVAIRMVEKEQVGCGLFTGQAGKSAMR